MKGHNKKRNVGIIYELLLRSVSSSLVSGDKEKAQTGLEILRRRFAKNSEIYSEFRIFNALANTNIENNNLALSLISESKGAARKINFKKLFKEKSSLIRDINKKLKDPDFFSRKIPNYKDYATIQSTINMWCENNSSNLSSQVIYEEKILNNILNKKSIKKLEDHVTPEVDSLVVKIMTEKFNSLYDKKLSHEQKTIIKEYVFSKSDNDHKEFKAFLKNIKKESISAICNLEKNTKNTIIKDKVKPVMEKINMLNPEEINDECIERFLKVSSLKDQILKEAK